MTDTLVQILLNIVEEKPFFHVKPYLIFIANPEIEISIGTSTLPIWEIKTFRHRNNIKFAKQHMQLILGLNPDGVSVSLENAN